MKLTRLRLVGFKSFVEPTDVLFEPGLTGVIGPNGCGKSNLVEALRWVMGETSHKSMRASGMDDVIFAGSANRPSRNTAEVHLAIDNEERKAPAAFNDATQLDVTRRIVRDEGSTYRINGREVRLRDVQLLFADAGTGPRSPALVRQGQIAELIAAKPQARRRILEDAAGIAGLHARRHEAELRLKAAEDNLLRVDDVLREIDAQVDSLKKQGRQASRYKNVSAEIRRLEALLFAIGYAEARDQAASAEREAGQDLNAVADAQAAQANAATAQAVAAHALPALREAEAAAAAALQRLTHARNELEAEERRARERLEELERQIADLERDIARQNAAQADGAATIARLKGEGEELARNGAGAEAAKAEAEARLDAAEAALAAVEAELGELQAQVSDLNARKSALAEDFTAALSAAEETLRSADERSAEARNVLAGAREAEARGRGPANDTERAAQRLETEVRTLAKLFASGTDDMWPKVLDFIAVAKGYETALGAALGEDLEGSSTTSAPVHWALSGDGDDDPGLPEGVRPLSDFVQGPDALKRRLAQIGIVARHDGPALRARLRPGQRLVSREGDLWRWDGFTAAADAPSAAARRLAEKNRLGDLERALAEARAIADRERAEAESAQAAVRAAASAES